MTATRITLQTGWWVLSKLLIFTVPVWFTLLLFSFQEEQFPNIMPEPWIQPDYKLSETSCSSWHNVKYDTCD